MSKPKQFHPFPLFNFRSKKEQSTKIAEEKTKYPHDFYERYQRYVSKYGEPVKCY